MNTIPKVTGLHNILVLRGEGSLGDALISSCCYREIKKANPNTKITVACFGSAHDFLAHNPHIDEVVRLPVRRLIRPNQRWVSLCLAGLKLRGKNFDLVLDSSDKNFYNWRLFKWLVGGNRVLDCFTSPVKPFGAPKLHASEHEKAILRLLGIENPDGAYDLPIPDKTKQAVDAWLTAQKIGGYVLFNPSGSVAKRRFRPDIVQALCLSLKELQLPIVIPATAEQAPVWQKAIADMPQVYVKQTANVFELFELVRRSTAVITPDTAVVHIASGFKKPSLVFYNTYSAYNAPLNEKALILQTEPEDVNQFNWWKMTSLIQQLHTLL